MIYSIKVNDDKYLEIKEYYSSFSPLNGENYVDYIVNLDGVVVTSYLSNKAKKTITFNGPKALEEVKKWSDEYKESTTNSDKKATESDKWVILDEQIGSDEVGVGDFLLPMVVVSVYIKASDIKKLRALGVDDSKKLDDNEIIVIAKELLKFVDYSCLVIPNQKYNEMILKGENINSLKAKMHNRALMNMKNKHPKVKNICIDEFVSPNKYFSYMGELDKPVVTNIIFHNKGESYFPSVAAASILARYSFLLHKEELEKKYSISIPCGAGSNVDKSAKKILEKIGKEEFDNLAKMNFKNYKRIMGEE